MNQARWSDELDIAIGFGCHVAVAMCALCRLTSFMPVFFFFFILSFHFLISLCVLQKRILWLRGI